MLVGPRIHDKIQFSIPVLLYKIIQIILIEYSFPNIVPTKLYVKLLKYAVLILLRISSPRKSVCKRCIRVGRKCAFGVVNLGEVCCPNLEPSGLILHRPKEPPCRREIKTKVKLSIMPLTTTTRRRSPWA